MHSNSWLSFDLPDDVFQPGETRPTRPKKKIVKKTEPTTQKRGIDTLEVSSCKDFRPAPERLRGSRYYLENLSTKTALPPYPLLRIANANFTIQGVSHGDAKRQVSSNGVPAQATPA